MHWQLLEPWFNGADRYTIKTSHGRSISIDVDHNGQFEWNDGEALPMGFARLVKPTNNKRTGLRTAILRFLTIGITSSGITKFRSLTGRGVSRG